MDQCEFEIHAVDMQRRLCLKRNENCGSQSEPNK